MRTIMVALLALWGPLTRPADACTCAEKTPQESFDQADAVFEGEVTAAATQDAPARAECPTAEAGDPPANFSGGCLDGTVRSARTCAPLVGAPVVAAPKEGPEHTAVTDKDGHWQMCSLPPGAYRLEASFDFAKTEQPVNVVEGEVNVVHFVLEMSDMEKARFKITKAYKGIDYQTEVMVLTGRNTQACGFGGFEVGKSYLVYGTRNRGNLYTGLCEGTKPSEKAGADLTFLQQPRKKGGCASCAVGGGGLEAGPGLVFGVLLLLCYNRRRGPTCLSRGPSRRLRQ